MPSDQALVRFVLLGSKEAANTLLLRHLAVLRADACDHRWQLPDGTDVDDALQAFFEKVCAHDFRALAQWQGLADPAEPSISPYFRAILRNVLRDLGRKRQAEPPREPWEDDDASGLPAEGDGANPEDDVGRAQLSKAIAACMATALDARDRKVIALKLADRSHEEVASALAITVANSRVLLNRALKRLRACLTARLRNDGAGLAVWE